MDVSKLSAQEVLLHAPAHSHLAYLKDDPKDILTLAVEFLSLGLFQGSPAMAVMPAPRLQRLIEALERRKVPTRRLMHGGMFLAMDTASFIDAYFEDGVFSRERFKREGEPALEALLAKGPNARMYGEVAPFLWDQGKKKEAIESEREWQRLVREYPVSILCGYRMDLCDAAFYRHSLWDVANTHTHTFTEPRAGPFDDAVNRALSSQLKLTELSALYYMTAGDGPAEAHATAPALRLLSSLHRLMPKTATRVMRRVKEQLEEKSKN